MGERGEEDQKRLEKKDSHKRRQSHIGYIRFLRRDLSIVELIKKKDSP